jgi:hypothetical protein
MVLFLQKWGDRKRITSYLESLREFVTLQKLHVSPCLWVMGWTLVVRWPGFQLDNPPRIWLAARVLWIAKRLPLEFVRQLEHALFSLIIACDCHVCCHREWTAPKTNVWGPQEFATALWEALVQPSAGKDFTVSDIPQTQPL